MSNPLLAGRRSGVVADIVDAPNSVNVYIGGDTDTVVPCEYLADYYPVVDDNVCLLENQGDYVILHSLRPLNQTKGPLGIVGIDSGPASTTDYTGQAVVCTLTIPLTVDRWYLMTARGLGTQITSAGTPVIRMRISGGEVDRAFTPTYGTVAANSVIAANGIHTTHATSTGNVTFDATAETGVAGALRIATNAIQLTVFDMGLIRP